MRSTLVDSLRPLADGWRLTVRDPRRRLAIALVVLVGLGALLAARHGTTRARIAAGGVIAASFALVALAAYLERRSWSDPGRVIWRLAGRVDPERARRALRALSLVAPDPDRKQAVGSEGTSAELARLHVARALAALPGDDIMSRARRVGLRLRAASLVVIVASGTLVVTSAWSLFEGADVLIARGGEAPVAMEWLDTLELSARAPDYLHIEEHQPEPYGKMALPFGTLLTFRGTATHAGRRVFLSDGDNEVPFVPDGSGRLVARWPIDKSVRLRVVARFGDVVIGEAHATDVTSVQDLAPIVKLEGAPKQIRLADDDDAQTAGSSGASALENDGEIPIRYEASDDHGLREVHLVLRSGTREERRVLARLDGDTRFDRGGHVLRARDPFLKKSHAPVEVRVEAKDNDPLTGPKWGASEALTLVPPDVGEPEARRLEALRKLRDAFVDVLAWRIGTEMPNGGDAKRALLGEESRRQDESNELLETTLGTTYAGTHISLRLQAMLRGQMRKVVLAIAAETRTPSSNTRAGVVKATEKLVLVTDAVVRGLGQRDTRDAARQLAEVADDLALGASQRERGVARMDASTLVLRGGARSMHRLGSLGRDIGEIIETDLLRVERATSQTDMPHAELAARDLAARLREPDPSFGSQGRSGQGGGESGGGRGTPGGEDSEPDEAQQAFNEAAKDLEQIAQDHAGEIGQVEQAMNGAQTKDEMQQMMDEARKHAEAVRNATRDMPSVGGGSDSWTSKGAAGKEHSEQMAKSLEQGNPADAVASGKNALNALDEAKRIASRDRWFGERDSESEQKIDDAKKKLEGEVKWAEQQLEALRKKAAERAGKELGEHGDAEDKLAERTGKLSDKGRDQGAMPQAALDALDDAERAERDAAQALKQGDADKALDRQREAQRKLEMAKQALGDPSSDGDRGGDADDGTPDLQHADIPKADQHKGPEEFRRRVIHGLGQPSSGRLKDAVKRYAEGLLR